MRRFVRGALVAVGAAFALMLTSPWVLAFPYEARYGETYVHAEAPIDAEMAAVLARADTLVEASPLASRPPARQIYLTNGGWRWRMLALQSGAAFGIRRPFSNSIILNRADVAADRVTVATGRTRSLSGIIAHETTHLMVAVRIGELSAMMLPAWKREGFADYVAQESTLSDDEAERLRANGVRTPALDYYDYRQRVETALTRPGASFDTLFRD